MENRRPILTEIGPVKIHTYFGGMDYRCDGRAPLLWNTDVYGGPLDGALYMNINMKAAQLFHELLCDALKVKMKFKRMEKKADGKCNNPE